MLVRLKCDRCGPYYGLQHAGEVVDLPEREAAALLSAGQAELVQPEAATATPAETAARPRPASRKR
jgi:hypothetical protein